MSVPDTVDTFDELTAFDQEYAPQAGRRPGIDTLPNGEYDFLILEAELSRTQKDRELILKLFLRVESSLTEQGKVVERAYFFRTQTSIDILGSDLCTLGFDADRWTPEFGRKFSQELPAAMAKLEGIKFRGKKTTKVKPGGETYHNLFVNARLADDSPPDILENPMVGAGIHGADLVKKPDWPANDQSSSRNRDKIIPF